MNFIHGILEISIILVTDLGAIHVLEVTEGGDEYAYEVDSLKEGADVKTFLEERYKFKNDNTSTRFKIFHEERSDPVFPEPSDERQLAWAFRAYAARRIVGGMETNICMYPYNVAISRSGKHWCGGSIIDEQWVLTAGHCMESAFDGDPKKLQTFIIRAGSSFHNRGGYQARVNKVFFPKEYSPGNADYDFSLLRLDRPMPIGRNIAVLNLPSNNYVIKSDDILIVSGWGSTDESGYGHIPDRLRFVPVPVMEVEACQKAYRFYITPRMLCAGYATGGKDACNQFVTEFSWASCLSGASSAVTLNLQLTVTNNEASDVPELQAKIKKARQREKELQKFKARVEEKKNKIKSWLRETLQSPTFIELAKKKLLNSGFDIRKKFRRTDIEPEEIVDDKTMDDINLSNLINDVILESDVSNDGEVLLTTLAMHELVLQEGQSSDDDDDAISTLIALINK
ncbi:unnamed protein product [Leptidea sinapis]|uniref:Peptidase S1 domain-containing protein n=1 Tax=Leptidea sinapis TaxID=189913 RepID=A0A5E4QQK8_9NEOP|nr:unnamed protein product [Leptidea sinapis]